MYLLYGFDLSRAVGVKMMLEEIGLEYEFRHADPREDDEQRSALLQINPSGFVPVLVTPAGETLTETAAIMLYLAETYPQAGLAPAADDPARGRFLCKLFYHTNEIQPSMKRTFYPHRFSTDPRHAPGIWRQAVAILRHRWKLLDDDLAANGPYHLGERFSMLDIHMAMWASYGLDSPGAIIDEFEHVKWIFEQVLARPRSGHLLSAMRDKLEKQR